MHADTVDAETLSALPNPAKDRELIWPLNESTYLASKKFYTLKRNNFVVDYKDK